MLLTLMYGKPLQWTSTPRIVFDQTPVEDIVYPLVPLLFLAVYVWFLSRIYLDKPLESLTVTEYTPADRAVMVAVVPPLLHKYMYDAVPPETLAVALPSELPLLALVLDIATDRGAGSVTVAEAVSQAPPLSVTVTM